MCPKSPARSKVQLRQEKLNICTTTLVVHGAAAVKEATSSAGTVKQELITSTRSSDSDTFTTVKRRKLNND
jgi:hypothetical protein